jgi:LAS superfamily LD-carboxypeptidase LdcB
MSGRLTARQLTGLDKSHLVAVPGGQQLQPAAAAAFLALQADAREAGFELAVASGYRSFARQCVIFNGKVSGARPVYDDNGAIVDLLPLAPAQRLAAILRYSAIPGTSRHHWGTDLDVYDAAAVAPGYRLQLSPAEAAADGVFGSLHRWLDGRMAENRSRGFFRPYSHDRGGVAPERWHLSFAPLALTCAAGLTAEVLRQSWDDAAPAQELLFREEIERDLPQLLARYVVVPPDWCPAQLDKE